MGIATWNILLNALIGVLVVSYGVWLKYVIDQQLKSKDTAIQALEAVIKSKEAEISSLKSEAAPAITQAYTTMRHHANEMTAQSLRLSEELKQARALLQNVPVQKLAHESNGILIAARILTDNLYSVMFPGDMMPEFSTETMMSFYNGFNATLDKMLSEAGGRTRSAQNLMERGQASSC